MRKALVVVILAVVASACSGEAESTTTSTPTTAAPATTTTTVAAATTTAAAATTTAAETTTTSTSTTSTTTVPPTVFPVAPPLPAGTVTFATVGGDFDGDGNEDGMLTYQAGVDDWRLRIVFADGGGADSPVVEGEDFAPPRPIGGFDIDGDGAEEVFVTVGSGASTVLVGFYDVAACVATRITEGGVPAAFPVGASIGNSSGIYCDGAGSVERNFAQYVADDEYEGGFAPYLLEGPVLTAFPGDGAGFDAAGAFDLAILDCGDLVLP